MQLSHFHPIKISHLLDLYYRHPSMRFRKLLYSAASTKVELWNKGWHGRSRSRPFSYWAQEEMCVFRARKNICHVQSRLILFAGLTGKEESIQHKAWLPVARLPFAPHHPFLDTCPPTAFSASATGQDATDPELFTVFPYSNKVSTRCCSKRNPVFRAVHSLWEHAGFRCVESRCSEQPCSSDKKHVQQCRHRVTVVLVLYWASNYTTFDTHPTDLFRHGIETAAVPLQRSPVIASIAYLLASAAAIDTENTAVGTKTTEHTYFFHP